MYRSFTCNDNYHIALNLFQIQRFRNTTGLDWTGAQQPIGHMETT